MGTTWDGSEVAATVEDYFSMFFAEMKGERYSKTEHRRHLIQRLNGRSDSSIEREHQNISAILLKLGLPYIEGYKPLRNYQALLENAVTEYLSNNPATAQELLRIAEQPALIPTMQKPDFQSFLVEPPPMVQNSAKSPTRSRSLLSPQFDFAKREANNRSLGKAGEKFVIDFEKNRLEQAGRPDLAEKVEWTAESKGHGIGYDILSFETNGDTRYIEVKTTNCGREFPFFISRNEVEFSREQSESFHLYRVFNFARERKLFILKGCLEDCCQLTAENFRAGFV